MTLQKVGIYFIPLLFWIVVNCSTATVSSRLDDSDMLDYDGVPRWFFANPAFTIAKKQMDERTINSLLRNAWIG